MTLWDLLFQAIISNEFPKISVFFFFFSILGVADVKSFSHTFTPESLQYRTMVRVDLVALRTHVCIFVIPCCFETLLVSGCHFL